MYQLSNGQVSLETKKFLSHPQWTEVKSVIEKLRRSGFVAWLAGGCVRDALMDRIPHDFDIVTDATPDEVQDLYPETLEVGKKFGISIIPLPSGSIEVATFRADGDYKDGRHPEKVEYASPEQDAQRRDFTINALFYDPLEGKIYDFVEGQKDLQARLIRCVGDPKRRFDEDQLRILRAIRFTSQLDFSIELKTWQAIIDFTDPLENVSKERVLGELEKIFSTSTPSRSLLLMARSPILREIFTLQSTFNLSHWDNMILKMDRMAQQKLPSVFLWTALFEAVQINDLALIRSWLKSWPVSRNLAQGIESISNLVNLLSTAGCEEVDGALYFEKHDIPVQFFDFVKISYSQKPELQQSLLRFYDFYVPRLNSDGKLPPPIVGGEDLIRLGIKKGPQIGSLLLELYKLQLKEEIQDPHRLLSSKVIKAYTSKEV